MARSAWNSSKQCTLSSNWQREMMFLFCEGCMLITESDVRARLPSNDPDFSLRSFPVRAGEDGSPSPRALSQITSHRSHRSRSRRPGRSCVKTQAAEFLDKWMSSWGRTSFCLWEEEIEGWEIIARLPQEIPGTCSFWAGFRVAARWKQARGGNGKK